MKGRVLLVGLALVAGACSDDDGAAIFPTTIPPGVTTSVAETTTTAAAATTTTVAPGTTAPVDAGPCPIPDTGLVTHIDFDDLPNDLGLLVGAGAAPVRDALAVDQFFVTQFDHTGWAGEAGPITETDAVIADNPAAVTPDVASLGTSSPPNVLRIFDEGHFSIAAHRTLPGQMDYIGFNVGFGHFSEGFERPETVELEVSVRLLPVHDLDGTITEAVWPPVTITLGPGPQPITQCVYLERPEGVSGHPLFSTWLVDIVPRHPDGTPIHLPVGIDDLFYGCFPGVAGGCATPWEAPGNLLTFAHADYSGNFYGLYVTDPVGGGTVPLFTHIDDRDLSSPAWSPARGWIGYTERGAPSSPDSGTINLYVIGVDGTGPFQLTNGGNVWGFDWSPDGSQIVYSLGDDDANADLWVVDAFGGVPVRLTDLGDAFGAIEPAWSPDGAHIVFERGERIDSIYWRSELYVMGAGGGVPTLLVGTPLHAGPVNHEASWSSASDRLAYASLFEDGGGAIWVVNVGAGTEYSISGPVGEALTPTWSPVVDRVAFFGFSGSTGIWVVNADDGSGSTGLPAGITWGSSVEWSADGTLLAYSGDAGATGEAVWVIAADGSPPVQATMLQGREYDADWSP